MYNVSNIFSSVDLQVFRGRKSRQFLVAFTIYYCILIIIESREVYRSIYICKYIFCRYLCFSVLYAKCNFSFIRAVFTLIIVNFLKIL